ncbi:MAG: hypothetical protein ACOX8N_07330 [Christensenellales bacterium]
MVKDKVNERELDSLLTQGKKEAGDFFSSFMPALTQLAAEAVSKSRRTWRPRAVRRMALAAVGIAAVLMFALLAWPPHAEYTQPGAQPSALVQADDTPADNVPTETVALGEDKEFRMNHIPTTVYDGAVPGIMTVLWELSGNGSQQMAYSSVFEYCDTVYPAMIIPFSGADYDMLLIASGDSAHGCIGYRLVGYRANAIQTWWSRDGLPGGDISVQDGVAVEKAADDSQQSGLRVTYIVPIQTTSGALALPVSRIRLGVGERLLLIGSNTDNVDAESLGGLMSREDSEPYGEAAAMFTAVNTGEDMLQISDGQAGNSLTVSIEEH